MDDEEVAKRAGDLLGSDRLDGDEVNLLSGRLRGVNDSLRNELRQVATERRAWSPWSHDGAGREHAEALDDLSARHFDRVTIEYDGTTVNAPLADLVDLDGKM